MIVDDPRQNYFIDVETFSNRYVFDIGFLGSYGHNFKVLTIDELLQINGVVIHDRVREGSDSALYHIWQYNGSYFDEEISNSIDLRSWLHIKLVIKLCNNKNVRLFQPQTRKSTYWLSQLSVKVTQFEVHVF